MKRTPILAGAGAVALAASLAACGSSASGSSSGSGASGSASASGASISGSVSGSVSTSGASGSASASGTSGATTGTSGVGGLANDADTLCTQIQKVRTDVNKVSLKNPSSIANLTTDFRRLQSAAGTVTKADSGTGHSHQLSTVVSDVDAAVAKGKAAFSAVGQGNTATLQSDFHALSSDLSKAAHQATHTSFQGCRTVGTSGG